MKKFFHRNVFGENGRGIRWNLRLARARGTGQSSSRWYRGPRRVTGLASSRSSSGTITVRDQYETSSRLKYDQRGSSMISTGIDGTPAQSYSPNNASRIFVNTLASTGPPHARIRVRAATMAGSSGGTWATFSAKYPLMVAERLAGPFSYRLQPPSGSCSWRR